MEQALEQALEQLRAVLRSAPAAERASLDAFMFTDEELRSSMR